MLVQFAQGFGIGGGLIVAIGAQNAYVLSQAVRRNYLLMIPLICIVCDAVLIAAGVSGVGTLVASNPRLNGLATWGGGLRSCSGTEPGPCGRPCGEAAWRPIGPRPPP